jgi:hypothetical protein
MKFGIKKSHEMISSIPNGIALLSEWNYRSSNKLCKLAQMTLDELYNKFRLYRVATLAKVKV